MGTNYIAPIWRMPRNANKDKLSNYSMDFQTGGSAGRHIGCGTDLFTGSDIPSISISVWIKTSASGVIMSKDITTNLNRNFLFQIAGNQLYWQTSVDGTNFDSLIVSQGTFNVIDSQWHHIVVTYNSGTSSGDGEKKIYIDGSEIADSPLATYGEIYNTSSVPIEIGRRGDNTRYFYDNMSQVCIFDYALDSTQVGYLYGLNNPMVPGAVNLTTPIAYWPLGDNSNPNAPGSFPNISVGADSVFNFSTQDNIESPHIDMTGAMSISGWFKTTDTGYSMIYQEDEAIRSPSGPDRNWFFSTVNNVLRFAQFYDSGGSSVLNTSGVTVNDGNWHHGVFVWDGTTNTDSMKIFVDGILRGKLTAAKTDRSNDDVTGMIGGNSATYDTNGELSNIQIWNTNLTYGTASVLGDVATGEVAELYNNGQPLMTGTQPQEANLKAWYKLNQSANYDQGIGPWDIEIVGTPDYSGTADGCYTTGTALRYADTGDQTTGSGNYFRWLTPLISCQGTIDITHTLGGEYVTASSGVQLTFQYSLDGGGWVTYHNELVSSSASTTPVTFTITSATGLSCNNNIKVRVLGAGGLFNASYIEFYNIKIADGAKTFYEQNFNSYSSLIGYNNGNVFNQSQVGNYIDPVWQIPDNRSAYPQSFGFTKTPQEYIDLGKDDWFSEYSNEITFSFWVNKTNWSSTGFEGLISKYGASGSTIQYRIAYPSSASTLQFYLQGSATDGSGYAARINAVTLTSEQTTPDWLHILWRHSASTNTSQVIFNGDHANAVSLTNIAANPYAQPQTTVLNMIGNVANGLQPFDGAISNYQRFNSYLDNATVGALYNDGVPSTTAIAPASSQAWYKLDNTEKFDGTNWSVENQKYPANWESALDFDGTNAVDLPTISFDMTNNLTLSCWINPKGFSTWDYLCTRGSAGGANSALNFRFSASGLLYSNYVGGSVSTGVSFPINQWSHLAITFNYSTGDVIFYKNGTPTGNTLTFASGYAIAELSNIGAVDGAGNSGMNSLISNFAVWESLQDISELYNNGTPALSYTNTPTAWWKLDNLNTGLIDSGTGSNDATNVGTVEANTFVSTEAGISSGMTEQNLVNNNVSVLNGESEGMNSTNLVTSNLTRTQPYSNYSFNFDATINDYITVPNPGSIFAYGEDAFTFSGWVSIDAYSDQDGIFARYYGPNDRATLKFGFSSPYNGIMFQTVKSGVNGYLNWNGILPTPADGEWKHICLTYASGTVKLYLDGADQGAGVLTGTIANPMPNLNSFLAPLEIARDAQGGSPNPRMLNGRTSNFCVFDRALTEDEILNIYNNGVTQDLQAASTFSNNILAWWPMDQRSSYYDGTDWVVRDLEGGKDGNGINTGNVEDMVGSAPGSQSNGVGSNFVIGYLEGNMKDSNKNAYSINMADYADGVTNPANSGRSTDTP